MSVSFGNVPLDEIRVDERYWPKGSSEIVRRWLAEDYRPGVMPPLHLARVDGVYYVIGWEADDDHDTLFETILGRDMTEEEKARARAVAGKA
jgi:hypothetical protein